MKEFYKRYESFFSKLFQYFIILVIFYIFVKYIFHYVAPFVLAFIFALILEPLVRALNKHLKLSRGISSAIVIAGVLGIIIFLGTGIVTKLFDQTKTLMENMPLYKEQIMETYNNLKVQAETYLYLIPEEIRNATGNIADGLIKSLTSMLGSGVKTSSVNIVSNVPPVLMFIVVNIIATFFCMKDKYEIEAFIIKKSPAPIISSFRQIKFHAFGALAGYFKAQLILMCCTGIICITVLTIIGSPYSLLMGILISIIDALPVFGSGFILWPWALWSLISGNYTFAAGLIINYLIVLLSRQILEPKVLGGQIGIHPLITLFSIYVGMQVFGIFGFIIGPITAVLIKAISTIERKI